MIRVTSFRKKPVEIEAVQWTGDNPGQLVGWMTTSSYLIEDGGLLIKTLEGTMVAQPGDWIIKGIRGEFYPCKPDIFADTYEEVGDATHANEGYPLSKSGGTSSESLQPS